MLLLDNDFFGQPDWRSHIDDIRSGGFKVSFNQGINARFLTPEAAEAIASVDYRADSMRERRIYTAWDSKGDERRLFRGLTHLCPPSPDESDANRRQAASPHRRAGIARQRRAVPVSRAARGRHPTSR